MSKITIAGRSNIGSRLNARQQAYPDVAPPLLVAKCRSGRFPGWQYLDDLLRAPAMSKPWRDLGKKFPGERIERLWQEISWAIRIARKRQTSGQRRNRYDEVGHLASQLRTAVSASDLDVLLYECFSPDVISINAASRDITPRRRIDSMNQLERDDLARSIMLEWPSVLEFLKGLEMLAGARARESMSAAGADARVRSRARTFARHLRDWIRAETGTPMNAAVAEIANTIFHETLTAKQVETLPRIPK
jgi:hypothetical protein